MNSPGRGSCLSLFRIINDPDHNFSFLCSDNFHLKLSLLFLKNWAVIPDGGLFFAEAILLKISFNRSGIIRRS